MATKQKLIGLFALMVGLVSGAVLGLNKLGASPAHAQTASAQTQAVTNAAVDKETPEIKTAENSEAKEGAEAAEPVNEQAQEKNLPGGGHQDVGQTDHQFEGVE